MAWLMSGAAIVFAAPASARNPARDNPALTYVQARAASMSGEHGRSAELLAALADVNASDLTINRRALSEAIGAGNIDLVKSGQSSEVMNNMLAAMFGANGFGLGHLSRADATGFHRAMRVDDVVEGENASDRDRRGAGRDGVEERLQRPWREHGPRRARHRDEERDAVAHAVVAVLVDGAQLGAPPKDSTFSAAYDCGAGTERVRVSAADGATVTLDCSEAAIKQRADAAAALRARGPPDAPPAHGEPQIGCPA